MLNQDFKEFAALLGSNQLEYLIVGGYALAAPGHPRYTGDLDFRIASHATNAQRLLAALKEFGFGALDISLGVLIDGLTLNFIAVEDLKTNKRAAGRPQDLADLFALERIHPGAP